MTLLDMEKLALLQMGEDTDAAALAEYGTVLCAYINEAYMDICRNKKQKYAEEVLSFTDARAALDGLTRDVVTVLNVQSEDSVAMSFEVLADKLFLNGGEDGDYTVCYLYLPTRLADDTDTPDVPEQDCHLMADYATYRALALGNPARQKRAEFFLMRYLSGYAALNVGKTSIINKY